MENNEFEMSVIVKRPLHITKMKTTLYYVVTIQHEVCQTLCKLYFI